MEKLQVLDKNKFDLDKLKKTIESATIEHSEYGEGFVEIWVGNGHGVYIPQIFYSMVEYSNEYKESDEWYWEEFEEVLNKANDDFEIIIEEIGVELEEGWNVYIGQLEGDLGIIVYNESICNNY